MLMFGPLGNVIYDINPEFSQFTIEQNKYQMNLSLWKKYIVWKYTVASAPITAFLLQRKKGVQRAANKWTLYFFDDYDIDFYGAKNIEAPFRKWMQYFENPKEFTRLNSDDQFKISKEIIELFQRGLRQIISRAPKTKEEFYVYKASGFYTGIPLEKGNLVSRSISEQSFDEPIVLEQKPFNSTTYNPKLDFDRFLERDKRCCMFEVKIPAGSNVLAISSYIHAHPYEKEILLLPDIDFEIVRSKKIGMTFIEGGVPKYEIQSKPYHIGPVFEENLPSSRSGGKWYELTLFETNLVTQTNLKK